MIRLFICWETSLLNVAAIFGGRAGNNFSYVGVAPREFWLMPEAQAQQIIDHQDLSIAVRPRTDTDRGDTQLGGNFRRDLSQESIPELR